MSTKDLIASNDLKTKKIFKLAEDLKNKITFK